MNSILIYTSNLNIIIDVYELISCIIILNYVLSTYVTT